MISPRYRFWLGCCAFLLAAVTAAMTIDIPYASTARPDTGVSNTTLGMWLFIASEVMLFGALFSSYVLLRTGDPAWPDQGR